MEEKKISKMVEAARMYYQLDLSQQEIAKKLGVSRPTVSRLLQQAKAEGIVRIEIMDPDESIQRIEFELTQKYRLKSVLVVPVASNDETLIKEQIGKRTAQYLHEIIKDNDIIAVTWGTTLYRVAMELQPKAVQGAQVVQLKGGVSHSQTNTYASEVLHLFGQAYHTTPHYLPLPAIVDSALVKETLETDRYIHRQLELARKANIAIFTVGGVMSDSLLFRLGYFSERDLALLAKRAVGDICSRFYDQQGTIVNEELTNRTVGIPIEELKTKEQSILVAGGSTKLEAIKGAIRGGYNNVLVTDQFTAKELLKK
ncbi:sugar-binding transcriptional regulator [Brevibacillus laterosporus]|uniref:Sugar-binding transcriptional regulator n=1 Tax=Brevibacillus laterosporus TaxID=1465 RepID=A0A518V957_BRELA|nr:sugar-binding transcriptional regulator [Brevibacillus laterosporus]QDX93525.1 sugar-binding transcriptional regulator [Brevibacillus laterosporus]TPG73271.1 sugar-binding transcriptional regulator [Brevibacillus laterosporus]